tara:strand:+ start:260 stop:892 length:633 start_codon:yes stop_codon:yes gene_type:complete
MKKFKDGSLKASEVPAFSNSLKEQYKNLNDEITKKLTDEEIENNLSWRELRQKRFNDKIEASYLKFIKEEGNVFPCLEVLTIISLQLKEERSHQLSYYKENNMDSDVAQTNWFEKIKDYRYWTMMFVVFYWFMWYTVYGGTIMCYMMIANIFIFIREYMMNGFGLTLAVLACYGFGIKRFRYISTGIITCLSLIFEIIYLLIMCVWTLIT